VAAEPCGRRRIDRSPVSPKRTVPQLDLRRLPPVVPEQSLGPAKPSPHFTRKGQTVPSDSNAVWAGIDVSQKWIDVAVVRDSVVLDQWRGARSVEGLKQAAQRLQQWMVGGVIVEPTGGLEIAVGAALAAVGIAALRVNAKRVRDFARAHGVLAKTDAIDARVLALFGERMRPEPRAWLDADRQLLADWIARQRQLVDLRTSERNRLRRAEGAAVRQSIQRTLRFFAAELKRVEAELAEWWDQQGSAWRESEARLRTLPGIGPKTARVLLAHLPELGCANRREIAALAGLAPFACDSGQWRGQRHIRGGRAVVRSALYLASWTAVRRAGTFRAIYENLVARGKPRQLALIAVARRMLLVLNELIRTGRDWQEKMA
jgi:transposase